MPLKLLSEKPDDQTTSSNVTTRSSTPPKTVHDECISTPPTVMLPSTLSPGISSPSWFPFHSPFLFRPQNSLEINPEARFSPRPPTSYSVVPGTAIPLKGIMKGKSRLGISLSKTSSNSPMAWPTCDSGVFQSGEQAISSDLPDASPISFASSTCPASPPYSMRFQSATSPYATLPAPFPVDMESRVSVTSAIEIYARQNEQAARIAMDQTLPEILQECSYIIHDLQQELPSLNLGLRIIHNKSKYEFLSKLKNPIKAARTSLEKGKVHAESIGKDEPGRQDEHLESRSSGVDSSPLSRINKRLRRETNDEDIHGQSSENQHAVNLEPVEILNVLGQSCVTDTRGIQETYSFAPKQPQHGIRLSTTTYSECADNGGKKRKRSPKNSVEPLSTVLHPIPEKVVLQQAAPQSNMEAASELGTGRPMLTDQPKSVTFAEAHEKIDADTGTDNGSSHDSGSPPIQIHGEDMLMAHKSFSKAARASYWGDILSKLIYSLLECGTYAKLFLQTDALRAIHTSPPQGLPPSSIPIPSAGFTKTQRKPLNPPSPSTKVTGVQHLPPYVRSKMIEELAMLIKGGNDILHAIEHYQSTRCDALMKMKGLHSVLGQEQCNYVSLDQKAYETLLIEQQRHLQYIDDRQLNRLWLCALE
ncbi:hypothetical protein BGZ65_003604, partial [Modicella reniformis]